MKNSAILHCIAQLILLMAFVVQGCAQSQSKKAEETMVGEIERFDGKTINRSDDEWKEILTEEQFYITRQKGTERAFTGRLLHEKRKGIYACICCGLPLFSYADKFESGSGWPSFTRPVYPENVATRKDYSHGMVRDEVYCPRCGAHLGHVFDDGPPPTGLRYCINSASLKFDPRP